MAPSAYEEWLVLRPRLWGCFGRCLAVGLLGLGLLWGLDAMSPRMRLPRKGPVSDARTQIGAFKTAVELYRVDHEGKPPTTRQGLLVLLYPPGHGADPHWQGPYLNDLPGALLDPWGHRYTYQSPGSQGEDYEITSYGADGKPGGEGNSEDLSTTKK